MPSCLGASKYLPMRGPEAASQTLSHRHCYSRVGPTIPGCRLLHPDYRHIFSPFFKSENHRL